jgi:hypothetical protein
VSEARRGSDGSGGGEGTSLVAPCEVRPDEAALYDILFEEDALYDEDARLAARELPPRAWRVGQRAVDEVMDLARRGLDQSWRQLREQVRRERMAAAIRGSFESRACGPVDQVSTTTSVSSAPVQCFEEVR